jgi:hypothetical protein
MMREDETFAGGCHCSAVRYRARLRPVDCGYCHCRICQRTTGAPVLAWTSFPIESFGYEGETPAVYRSSKTGQREFCSRCGTQVAYRQDSPSETIDVNSATLDDPGRVRPSCHTWTSSRIPWFDTADDLPRYEAEEPGPARK